MKNRSKHGFCWCFNACWVGPDARGVVQSFVGIKDRVAEMVMSSVSQYLDAFRVSLSDRLTALKARIGPVVTPPFSRIYIETLDERAGANKDRQLGLKQMPLVKQRLFILSRF